MCVKSSGMVLGLANAWPPGSAKFANDAPPVGLTRQANQCPAAAWEGGGGGGGAAGAVHRWN